MTAVGTVLPEKMFKHLHFHFDFLLFALFLRFAFFSLSHCYYFIVAPQSFVPHIYHVTATICCCRHATQLEVIFVKHKMTSGHLVLCRSVTTKHRRAAQCRPCFGQCHATKRSWELRFGRRKPVDICWKSEVRTLW